MAVVQNGSLVSLQHLDPCMLDAHRLPHELSVSPLCVVGGQEVELNLKGRCLAGEEASVLLKSGGQYLPVSSADGDGGGVDKDHGLESVSCSFKAPQVCGEGATPQRWGRALNWRVQG
jgi:hypothetical protein